MDFREHLDLVTSRDWEHGKPAGTVRIAMLGLGWWTREEAIPAVEHSDYCETTVVVSGSKGKAREVAEETSSIRRGLTYEEYHRGEATDEYDAVYVCTPNATHLELVETAAGLGKHVLCEKPMEVSVERAERLVEVCDAAQTTLMIAYRMQTEPAVRRARELIADGIVGVPIFAHSSMSADLLELIPDPDQWRLDPELAGGCALIDLGIYPINTLRVLLDEDPIRVTGTVRTDQEAFSEVDEHTAFQLEFPSMVANCSVSHGAYMTSHLRVLGTEGELQVSPIYHPWEERRIVLDTASESIRLDYDQVDQMREEFDYFGYCLLENESPRPDGPHGIRDIEIVEAIYAAAEAGTWLSVDAEGGEQPS